MKPLIHVLIIACLLMEGYSSRADGESSYKDDMQAFLEEIDTKYPFFELKGIENDWKKARRDFKKRAKACKSDEEFIGIILDTIRCLRDGHMRVQQTKVPFPKQPERYYPGISFLPATEDRTVVMNATKALSGKLKTGTVITKIDGKDAKKYLEERAKESWEKGGFFSSPQRARLLEYRQALRGNKNDKHELTYLDGGKTQTLTVSCDTLARGWPHYYNCPKGLKRVGRSFYHTRLEGDVGYIYLRRIDSSVLSGMEEAIHTHPDMKGWIIDLRGNGGGGYDGHLLIDRINALPKPIAVLIDAGCFSAGETLARDIRARAEGHIFGSPSAGSSSAKYTWDFPSKIASLTLSRRSRWRGDRKPIEFNGIEPDTLVEAVPEELQEGENSATLRALEYILSK